MALLPYLFEELRPARPLRLRDQLFGLDLNPEDILEAFDRPATQIRRYLRPWGLASKDIGSTIKTDKDKFQVNLDVQHFDPEEISVKTADGFVVVEGKHEERKDGHGLISRQFKRRYNLPEGCNPDTVESRLSSDGVLTVTAPRNTGADERAVPITQTGPIRRKVEDETVEDKTPKKKLKNKE